MTAADGVAAASHVRLGGFTVWPPVAAARSLWRRGLARDVALLQASNTLQKGYGAVYNVLSFRLLGDTAYGELLLVLALYNTVNLLGTLGLGQFLVVPIAQAAAAGDRKEVARACAYNLKLSFVIAIGIFLVSLTIGPLIGGGVFNSALGARLGGVLWLAALAAFPSIAYTLATTSLQAVRRMGDLALVENVEGLLFRSGGLVALALGFGVPGVLAGTAAGSALSAAHAIYRYRRVAMAQHDFPGFRELVAEAVRVPFGRYLRFSALAVADKNVAQFFGQTPLLFLGRWASAEQAAYFGVAAKLYTLLAAFHGAASKALSVRLSQEYGQNGAAPTRRLFWRTLLVWGSISIVAAAAFTCLLPIFQVVYGPAAFPSLTLVILFALLIAKQGFTVTLGAIFLILDRVFVNVAVKVPLLLAAMPVGALLVQQWGAVGAAAYQLGAYLVGDLVYFSLLATPWFWRERAAHARQDPR